MTFSKYIEIPYRDDLPEDNVEYGNSFIMEEKIDGSNFRFGIFRNEDKKYSHNVMVGSKNVDITDIPEDMFSLAVNWVNETIVSRYEYLLNIISITIDKKVDEVIFYGEFLKSPQHNNLKYDRVPKNNIILFDVMVDGKYVDYSTLLLIASLVDLETVPVLWEKKSMFSLNEIESQLNTTSILGGSIIEGVVIKSYDSNMYIRKKLYPYMIKFVREEFKESNTKNWKEKKADELPVNHIVKFINKENLWNKAIQHATDDGKTEGTMRDMRFLVDYVKDDIENQWKEVMKEELWKLFEREIKMKLVKGLPEYYKKKLGLIQNEK